VKNFEQFGYLEVQSSQLRLARKASLATVKRLTQESSRDYYTDTILALQAFVFRVRGTSSGDI